MCAKISPNIQDTYHYEPQLAEITELFEPNEEDFWDNYSEYVSIPPHTFVGSFSLLMEILSEGGIYEYHYLNIHEQPEKNLFWVLVSLENRGTSVQNAGICVLIRVEKTDTHEKAQIFKQFPHARPLNNKETIKSDLLEVCENGLIALSFRIESRMIYGGTDFFILQPDGNVAFETHDAHATPRNQRNEPFFAKDAVFLLGSDQSYLFFWFYKTAVLQKLCLQTLQIVASSKISTIFELYMPAPAGDLLVVTGFSHNDLLILDPCDLKPVKRTDQDLQNTRFAALQTFYRPRDAWNRQNKNPSFYPQEDFAAYCEWTFPPKNEHKTCEVIQHINYLPSWHTEDLRLQFCSFQDNNRALLAYICPNSCQNYPISVVIINARTKEKIGIKAPLLNNPSALQFGKNGDCLYIGNNDAWYVLALNFHKPLPHPRPAPRFSEDIWKLLKLVFSGDMENIQLASEMSAGFGVDLDACLRDLNFSQIGISKITNINPQGINLQRKEFVLRENNVWDLSPLQYFPNLEVLNCHNKLIRDLRPLAHLKNLKELYLSDNFIQSLDGLENLTNLEILDCANNQLSDIRALANLKKLKVVNLANNIITDLSPLADKLALQKLNISSNPAHDALLCPLASCLNLEILKIEHMWMFALEPLYKLAKLKKLYHSQNLRWQNTVDDFDKHRKANSHLAKCDTPTTAPFE